MFTTSLLKKIRAFRKDTRGSVAVESVIMWPALFLAMIAMAVLFDAYRARSTTEKAAYAISDMMSRETAAVDHSYLEGMHALLGEISTLRSDHDLIVSLIAWDLTYDRHRLVWSHSVSQSNSIDLLAWDQTDLTNMSDNLPLLVPGESLIVVQTKGTFSPLVNMQRWWGDEWDGYSMDTLVFSRPRFVSNLAWASS